MELRDVNLVDPDIFVAGVPHDMFRVLRREAPVYFHPEPDGAGFWVLTKYDDVRHAGTQPRLFSSQRQATLIRDPTPEELPMLQAIMLNMDPPQHRQYRKIVSDVFTPRVVRGLEAKVRTMVNRVIDRVAPLGECDFVDAIAAPLPMEVICEMVGVPEEDRRHIYDLTNRMIGSDDPEFEYVGSDYKLASSEMFGYATKLAERVRRCPAEDLGTALLHAEVDGQRLSELEYNSFFLLLAVAGNETTRTVTTNGMLNLIEHPDQRRLLLENPALIPSAIEEILRYNPPVHYFRRTATADTEIRGVKIRESDKVTLWYPAANRDEDAFADPDAFDVRRQPNEHLAFGFGEHFCLGAWLARLELRVMFEELLRRLPDIELAAAPRRLRSNFINGVKEMRVRFTPRRPEER
jgi:cytochrome P450